jgi:hypothetical protein
MGRGQLEFGAEKQGIWPLTSCSLARLRNWSLGLENKGFTDHFISCARNID